MESRMRMFADKFLTWSGLEGFEIVLVLLALVFSVRASYLAGFDFLTKSPVLAPCLWLLAGVCMLGSGARMFHVQKKIVFSYLGWFLLFFVLALPLRVIDTSHFPISLSGDEADAAMFSVNYVTGRLNNIFSGGWNSYPAMFSVFQAGAISLFGQTLPAIRVVSGVIGALTVGAVYWLGRELFDHKVGLIAAIGLLGLAFHIHFSRVALNNVCDGLSFCLVLACLWAGWRRENRFFFTLGGLFFGFSLYFYETSKVLVVLVCLWLLLLAIQDREKFRRCLPAVLLFFIAAIVAAFPLLRFYGHHPQIFFTRFSRFAEGSRLPYAASGGVLPLISGILQQLGKGFGGYICVPLKIFYDSGTGVMRPLESYFFCLGVITCLIFIKDRRVQMCLLWVTLFGLLGSFTDNAPAAQRYVGAAPACMLLLALGVVVTENGITKSRYFRNMRNHWKQVFALVFVVLLAVNDTLFYFRDFQVIGNYGGGEAIRETALALNLNKIPGERNLYYYTDENDALPSFLIFEYLSPQVHFYGLEAGILPENLPGDANLPSVFVSFDKQDQLVDVKARYPGGITTQQVNWHGDLLFYEYRAPVINLTGSGT